jgi:hypothetical protein
MFTPASSQKRGESGLSTSTSARKSSLSVVDDGLKKKWESGEKCDRLRVVVCSARNIMAKSYMSKLFGGFLASSDCQCNLKFGSRELSTTVVEGTLEPSWNLSLSFNYDPSNPHHDRLHVDVFHAGIFGPKLLGTVNVPIDSLDDSVDRCTTKWYKLQSGPASKDKDRSRGEILLSLLRHPVRINPTRSLL